MKEVNVKVLIPDDVDPKKVLDLSLMVRYQKENDKWQFVTMPFALTDSAKTDTAKPERKYIDKTELVRKLNAWDCKAHGIPNYAWRVINEVPTHSFPDSAEKLKAEIEDQKKWLSEAGYNAYNVDIAFSSIRNCIGRQHR